MFAWHDGENVFHGDSNDVKGKVRQCEWFIKGIKECIDHTLGEGVEEDDAFFCGGNGWFPQLLKVREDVEG